MSLTERITRIVNQPGRGLLAADALGNVHLLDTGLKVLTSSGATSRAQVPAGDPVFAITVAGRWIITRDKLGTISRWDATTLRLVDRLDAAATCDRAPLMDGEEPSPTMVRGIGVWNGKVYLSNGYFQLVVLDLDTFAVEHIQQWNPPFSRLEWFCTDAPGVQAVSDRNGRVYIGSLDDLDFPVVSQVDSSNIHRLLYDSRHHRFWATLDGGTGADRAIRNGVATVGLDGQVLERSLFARNDVEALALSPDFSKAYVGGFDGELLIFDNTAPELRIAKRVTGFSHQIFDIAVDDNGAVHVLSQDGEIATFDPDGAFLNRLDYARQSAWDIRPVPGGRGRFAVATDDGAAFVDVVEPCPGHPALRLSAHDTDGAGFTRRILPTEDGWFGIAWPREVLRTEGERRAWTVQMPDIVHTLALSPDGTRLLVACNAGGIELDAETGQETGRITDLPASAWVSGYLADGRRLLGSRNGLLRAYDAAGEVTWEIDLGGYPKRLDVFGDRIRVTGAGGVKEYLVDEQKADRQFVELFDNTVECATLIDGTLCAVSYGMQLGAFDYETGELVGFAEDLPDYSKSIASFHDSTGAPVVVVGGRSGFLRLYRLDRSTPQQVLHPLRELWLPRTPACGDFQVKVEADGAGVR
ncbi:PQQ-binding-like beta-propeller repeat protein [Streptomyces sp. MST-110588]|uniref:outer membrane protein assembly factor BamB family protein n=1 Tax=Streptomyces sp. MST-110588 TaxID=2833628 RepID=UPI001F5DB57E|nr:PQQ-binding-like beta-propeller repeat protein [Streptomyces sp. MST-110588]UNO38718.1 PQQ-binding-like beta-propeller repeat protein [Streptomyces sp. MST-110588]